MYAIGGSANPTINSQGNRFLAPDDGSKKETGAGASSTYARASSLSARPSSLVGSLTATAGALNCRIGSHC
ncbi:hypothetical protein V6N13_042867 [Hibiscus sabdariffa]